MLWPPSWAAAVYNKVMLALPVAVWCGLTNVWLTPLQVIAVAEDLQASLEDVFYEFQVDLTWHGHDHIYGERFGLPPVLQVWHLHLHSQRQTRKL